VTWLLSVCLAQAIGRKSVAERACISGRDGQDAGMKKRISTGKRLALLLGGAGFLLAHGWALMAVYFWFSGHPVLKFAVVLGYLGIVAGIFKVARTRSHGAWASLVLVAVVALWWSGRKAETGLSYPQETEQDANLTMEGDSIRVSGIRNFQYRSVTDFEPHWSSRTYELSQLEHVDLFFNYWGVPDVAHVMTSFVFKEQPPLAVSIELRAEKGEPNTLLRGFFKQYELHYVWADERDVVQLRTNHRKEQVYLYRTSLKPEQGRRLLKDMALRSNQLVEEPEFYNTLTDNCTNVIAQHVDRLRGESVPWYRRPLLTGRYEKLGYDNGWLLHTLPWEEHRAAASINARAEQGGAAEDFSTRIRTHLAGSGIVEQYPEK